MTHLRIKKRICIWINLFSKISIIILGYILLGKIAIVATIHAEIRCHLELQNIEIKNRSYYKNDSLIISRYSLAQVI